MSEHYLASQADQRTAHGLDPYWCRYCCGEPCVNVDGHIEREIAWGVYTALRDGVNGWRTMPLPSAGFLDGFYGADYPDVVFPVGGCFER